MSLEKQITGVVVSWNNVDIIETALTSIRKFHDEMSIIVVDGSDKENECYRYLHNLIHPFTKIIHTNFNIGHGRGLNLGISHVTTPYILCFDSDIEMIESPLEEMLNMFDDTTYGVGCISYSDLNGFPFEPQYNNADAEMMLYLQPFFQMIQLSQYVKYSPFLHHGAPAVGMMKDLHIAGLSQTSLKNFPDLPHSFAYGTQKYIKHAADQGSGGVTGSRRVKAGLPHIEGPWEHPK